MTQLNFQNLTECARTTIRSIRTYKRRALYHVVLHSERIKYFSKDSEVKSLLLFVK